MCGDAEESSGRPLDICYKLTAGTEDGHALVSLVLQDAEGLFVAFGDEEGVEGSGACRIGVW